MLKIKVLVEQILAKLFGFSVVGLITTIISVALIYIVIYLFNGPLVLSYIIIYTLSIFLSYLLNMFYVFNNQLYTKEALIYFGIYLSGMGLGALFLEHTKDVMNMPDVWKAYITIPITLTWNFGFSFAIFNSQEDE